MSKNMGIITGSTALVSVGVATYYLNKKMSAMKSDLDKVISNSAVMIKQVDTVDVNGQRIVAMVNILDQIKKSMEIQQHRMAFLTDAVIDIQKTMYNELNYNPKLIPKEFLLIPSMLINQQKQTQNQNQNQNAQPNTQPNSQQNIPNTQQSPAGRQNALSMINDL